MSATPTIGTARNTAPLTCKEAGMCYQTICLLAGTLAILGLGFAYLFVRAKKAAYS